jgi:hypothetical protein
MSQDSTYQRHRKSWQYLRDRYLSGRLFSGTRAIVDACCEA